MLVEEYKDIPLLARTHGQPASPTRLGKEVNVFLKRIEAQMKTLIQIPYGAKFSGATGNFNAHHIAYPNIDWKYFGSKFVEKTLGLNFSFPTTQIEHYDSFAALCDNLKRINTIIIDLNRDRNHINLITEKSDGIEIPGNKNLSKSEKLSRINNFHETYNKELK